MSILDPLALAGLRVSVEDGRLRVSPRDRLTTEARAYITEHKAELLALLTAPPRWRYLIRHADGRLAEHDFDPPATLAQIARWYPGALSITPVDDPPPDPPEPIETHTPWDDRRTCRECTRLSPGGRCTGAPELPQAMTPYHPDPDRPKRCAAYLPRSADPDKRPGRVRWPGQARRNRLDSTEPTNSIVRT